MKTGALPLWENNLGQEEFDRQARRGYKGLHSHCAENRLTAKIMATMAEVINAMLERICNSETFRLAHQQREFLSFLIHRIGGNSSDGFKESLLGIEFFGRKPGYDPKADPIVRVEAHRLRRRLETYYRKEGAADPQRIELGKGSYLPILVTPSPCSAQGILLAVLVRAEEELTSVGMTAELVRSLGKLNNLRVLAPQSTLAAAGDAGKALVRALCSSAISQETRSVLF